MGKREGNDHCDVGIQSIAFYVPDRVVKNHELAQMVNTSDEWIVSHTGIYQRYIAAPEQSASDLAFEAAIKVLRECNKSPEEVDLIIFATSTPDYHSFPSTACVLQNKLACHNAAAFDIGAACSGFIYAVEVGRSMLASNPRYKNVLVVGAEVLSRVVNWQDRGTCILFGDGAGAALLTTDSYPIKIMDSILRADGRGAEDLWIPSGGSASTLEQRQNERTKIEMNGRAVYNFAVKANQEILHEILDRNHLSTADLRFIVPHQANERIIKAVAQREALPFDLFYMNIGLYGNTSAASIPIALTELQDSHFLQKGDLICCIGFGAGLTYGGLLLSWEG